MRKFIRILSFYLLCPTLLLAASACGSRCNGWPLPKPCEHSPWPSPFNMYADVGFRADKFKWSLPGSFGFPNTQSEIKWTNLRMIQYGGMAEWTSCANYTIRLDGNFGHIFHGKYRDTDYAGDDKTVPYELSVGNASKGHVFDLSGAVGYRMTSTETRLISTLLVGYSEHGQYLHMYDGEQKIALDFHRLGPITGLNSYYTTRWFGPWFGLDFEAKVEKCASVFGCFKWHMLTYRGHGLWNLREDIGPFYHRSYGYGYEGILGTSWEIWGDFSVGIVGSYRMFRTKKGHATDEIILQGHRKDDVFVADESFHIRTHFSGAIWHSFSISGLVSYRF